MLLHDKILGMRSSQPVMVGILKKVLASLSKQELGIVLLQQVNIDFPWNKVKIVNTVTPRV